MQGDIFNPSRLLRILTLVFCFWALYSTAHSMNVTEQGAPRAGRAGVAVRQPFK